MYFAEVWLTEESQQEQHEQGWQNTHVAFSQKLLLRDRVDVCPVSVVYCLDLFIWQAWFPHLGGHAGHSP